MNDINEFKKKMTKNFLSFYDFNIMDAFRTIDFNSKGFITVQDIKIF